MPKKVLILSNSSKGLFIFRGELIRELLKPGSYIKGRKAEPHEVIIASPYDNKVDNLTEMGCRYIETTLDRRRTNPLNELRLISLYWKTIKNLKPDIVFSYTIKPNIYGGIVCRLLKIPYVLNITGLGTAVETAGLMQKLMVALYRIALPGAQKIFFQNEENRQFFTDRKLAVNKHKLLPGSGVNLERFSAFDYPNDDTINFAFISRIMKEKGIEQYLEAAKTIRSQYPNTRFHIYGRCEYEYNGCMEQYLNDGIVEYHGIVEDMVPVYRSIHCVVHPTYYPEGMSNVLLEACATARPIITTDRSGCREVIDDEINGYIIKQQNSNDLIEKLKKFIQLTYEQKKAMGIAGRLKVEKCFDRKIVVEKYLEELECADK